MGTKEKRSFLCLISLTLFFVSCSGQNIPELVSHTQESIRIEGSNALEPFISTIVPLFAKEHLQVTAKVKGGGSSIESQVNVQVQGGGSVTGLNALTEQKTDICMTDIYADPTTYSSPNLTDQIVAVIPYVLIANPDLATIQSLSSDQITQIFSTRTISNWRQVGGPDLPVVPISEDDNVNPEGNTDFFSTTVLGGNPERGRPIDEDSATNTLSVIAHTPGALGYIAASLVDNSVDTLDIDGLAPTIDNVASNRYHFWVYGHLYTLKDKQSSISSFLTFAVSPVAQQIAQHAGYVPLARMQSLYMK